MLQLSLIQKDFTSPKEFQEKLALAFQIRRAVFIEGQNVPEEDDFDGLDEAAFHVLAIENNQKPIGTARFRVVERDKNKRPKKIKLERFAVLEEARGKGIGEKMVRFTLQKIKENKELKKAEVVYLHAQLAAVSLYARCGFDKKGEMFEESRIRHYKMIWEE